MALDVYVMPLWRFKAGYFESPLERLAGGKLKTVTPEGIQGWRYRWRFWRSFRARADVQRLVSEAEQRLGLALKWEDNGPVVHAEQAWWGFVALQTFAKWIDYRDLFPSLEPPPEDSFYKHPIYLLKEPRRPFTYPHLIDHSCYSGYLLPCAFNEVLAVEPHQVYHWTFFHSLGSAPTMYEELERLEKMVYEPTIRSHVVSSSDLELIDAGFNTLREVTKKSLESSLPVIFYG